MKHYKCKKCGKTDCYTPENIGDTIRIRCICQAVITVIKPLSDYSKMRFGKYKGERMKDVPVKYLIFMLDNNYLTGKLKEYARKRVSQMAQAEYLGR